MTTPKQRFPSLASTISALGIVLCCVGFLRVELELNNYKKRLNAVENVAKSINPLSSDSIFKSNARVNFSSNEQVRIRRQANLVNNNKTAKATADTLSKINKLLTEGRLQLCQSKGDACRIGPPGPPGPPGRRGEKGDRGRRGKRGALGKKGDRGIMGSPGKKGKQGIMGPAGHKGDPGLKGQKGDTGPAGMPGTKGDPGESISAPVVAVSPSKLTVNESGTASFQCSVSGNPEPAVVWSKMDNQSQISHSAVSRRNFLLKSVKASDSGEYRCSVANILGQAHAVAILVVNVRPRVSLHPGPIYVGEGSNVTLPTCHVIGHPTPVVRWSKAYSQLPQGRVQKNNTALRLIHVSKTDSNTYLCSASNILGSAARRTQLVVVPLPTFIKKPPTTLIVSPGENVTLNCSAAGDPKPVIRWTRQGGQLPLWRSDILRNTLIIRIVKVEDTGNYTCIAISAGLSKAFAMSYVSVIKLRDCSDLLKSGHTQSGVYSVDPDGKGSFNVYCDMRTDGGGWTVFQRRQDGSVDFYRGWNDYKSGFGQLTAEFWLGNDKIHRLTAARPSSLRVELEDWSGVRAYAKYGKFNIGDEQTKYRLEVGSYSGTAGNSLLGTYNLNNMAFTTKDRDNDRYSYGNCAVKYTGAWWYNNCHNSNLNGKYLGHKYRFKGVVWNEFKYQLSLKYSEMKLRPSS